jgi:TonB family protein
MPDWKQWEGELLDGKYPLERYAGGDEASAVFLIGFASTAVRIYRAGAAQAAALAERWNRVKLLHHPHLLEIDSTGVSTLGGEPVAYVVMEHADENLGEILETRPLAPNEAREMLLQMAGTLADLHGQGLAHREVRASNILAIGESVKLTSDSIAEGDAAADLHALGLTLIHALTQRTEPTALPGPFGAIARGCLEPDPARRWNAERVVAALRAPASTKPSARRFAVPAAVAVAAIAIVGAVALRRPGAGPSAAERNPRPATAAIAPTTPVTPAPAPANTAPVPKTPPPVRDDGARSSRDRLANEDGVSDRVEPKIAESARRTIDGRPAVVVRVTVDAAGDVTQAAVERSFSPYFSRLSLDAARKWKFIPEETAGNREWVLRFQFSRAGTQMTARRASGQ